MPATPLCDFGTLFEDGIFLFLIVPMHRDEKLVLRRAHNKFSHVNDDFPRSKVELRLDLPMALGDEFKFLRVRLK